MTKFIATFFAGFCLTFFLAGCEGDDGGESHDFGDNDPNLYVAVGDSLTEGLDNPGYPPILAGLLGKTVINAGVGGATSYDGVDRCNAVLNAYSPGYILIWYGANDATHNHPLDEVIANLRTMIEAAKANKTIPYIATLTPMYGEHTIYDGYAGTISDAIIQLASEEGVGLVDLRAAFDGDESLFIDDGLHFTQAGYNLVAQTFNNALQ